MLPENTRRPPNRPKGSRGINEHTIRKMAIAQALRVLFPAMSVTSAAKIACAIYDRSVSKDGHKNWSRRREFFISDAGIGFAPVESWRPGDADEEPNQFESEERNIRNRLTGANRCGEMSFHEFRQLVWWGESVMVVLGSKTSMIAEGFAGVMADKGFPDHARARLLAIARRLHAADADSYNRLPQIDPSWLRRDMAPPHPIRPAVSALTEILREIAAGRDPFAADNG